MLETFTAQTLSPHVNSTFRVVDGPELQLDEVRELGEATGEARAPFSIVFSGPPEPILPQRTYQVEHGKLGSFDLFLVPLAPGRYEAVFS